MAFLSVAYLHVATGLPMQVVLKILLLLDCLGYERIGHIPTETSGLDSHFSSVLAKGADGLQLKTPAWLIMYF